MTYAALLREPGQPPQKIGPYWAADDGHALACAKAVAEKAAAALWMLWETRDGKARRIDVGA